MRKCIILFGLILCGCFSFGVNVIRVISPYGISTGFMTGDGRIITTEHPHEKEDITIRSPLGYIKDYKFVEELHNDIVAYGYSYYKDDQCYTNSYKVGDKIIVSTFHGPVWGDIVKIEYSVFYIDVNLNPGDSGSPVSSNNCIAGIAHAKTKAGVRVIKVIPELTEPLFIDD